MKNAQRFGLSVLLVFVFSFCVYEVSAQPNRSLAMRQMQKDASKRMLRSFWDGDGTMMAFGLIQHDDFREGIGVSKEQFQKMQDTMRNMGQRIMDDPELKKLQEEIREQSEKTPGDPFSENPSPELRKKFIEIQEKAMDISARRMKNIIDENITPEQMQKVKEFQISTMSEMPIVSPNMFEALGLSDDQKKQLEEIKKKMEPEFEKNLDSMIDFQIDFGEEIQSEIGDKTNGVTDMEKLKKIYQDARKKVVEKNPEFKQMENDMRETGKAFVNKLKFQMFDVLTDEQMERMGQLINNPPPYVKKTLAQRRKAMGEEEEEEEEEEDEPSGEWKPSLNSWKPGDPIPKEYLEQRKAKRFPSKSDKN